MVPRIVVCFALLGSVAHAQSLRYTPEPVAAYTSSDGLSWNPLSSAAGYGALGFNPSPRGLYCQASAGAAWTPCIFTGGGGSANAVGPAGTLNSSNGSGGLQTSAYSDVENALATDPRPSETFYSLGTGSYVLPAAGTTALILCTSAMSAALAVCQINSDGSYSVLGSITPASMHGALVNLPGCSNNGAPNGSDWSEVLRDLSCVAQPTPTSFPTANFLAGYLADNATATTIPDSSSNADTITSSGSTAPTILSNEYHGHKAVQMYGNTRYYKAATAIPCSLPCSVYGIMALYSGSNPTVLAGAGTGGFQVQVSNNEIGVVNQYTSSVATDTTNLTVNTTPPTFFRFAITYTTTTVDFYINGTKTSSHPGSYNALGNPLYVGINTNGTGTFGDGFNGELVALAFYGATYNAAVDNYFGSF